jgi:hypothetical protein
MKSGSREMGRAGEVIQDEKHYSTLCSHVISKVISKLKEKEWKKTLFSHTNSTVQIQNRASMTILIASKTDLKSKIVIDRRTLCRTNNKYIYIKQKST